MRTIESSVAPKSYYDFKSRAPLHNPVLKNTGDLDDLVRRVQDAIGDAPRTPEFKRIFTDRYSVQRTPPEPTNGNETEHLGELSIASKQYLKKYGLLPPSPKHQRSHQSHQPYRPSKLQDRYHEDDYLESPTKYRKGSSSRYGDENDRILPNLF
jgi:hypothetical protein